MPDLTPLAYVAGTVAGIRNIRVFALHDAAHLALLAQVCTALRWHPHYLVCEYVQVYAHCSMIRAEA